MRGGRCVTSPPVVLAIAAFVCVANAAESMEVVRYDDYDVVIAGGSTAALAAAFSAADEGARTALIEPTDWIGGQLTASGVPAVDEAWHQITRPGGDGSNRREVLIDVRGMARDPRNITPFFRNALQSIGNPGLGWVSRYCFQPRQLLDNHLLPREQELADRLTVFRNTVVKQVITNGPKIVSLTAIQRSPKADVTHNGYDRLPSFDLADWYSQAPSPRYAKRQLTFTGRERPPVFIDATEWGELLVLSRAPYLQGVERVDGELAANDRCGQAVTFGFVQRYHQRPVADHPDYPSAPNLGFGIYHDKPDAWQKIWTYRRLYAAGDSPSASEAAPGDLSLQNWEFDPETGQTGNDYPDGYLLLSKQDAAKQTSDWQGGVDLQVMAAAERQAFAWHDWFRHAAPPGIDPDAFTIEGEVLGTGHGLSKLPYMRDTRRSIGIDGFLLTFDDQVGPSSQDTGTRFADRVALAAYAADIHQLAHCQYPERVTRNHPTLPFYIPYRSLTNDRYDNLLVAGKTMAQTFLANSSTRLQPIEWSSGTAAGVIAHYMAAGGKTSREAFNDINEVQERVRRHTPIDWTTDATTISTESNR
ncbi:MAG: FAD-dependent oxidoreductase [Planctomycetota bacterium]